MRSTTGTVGAHAYPAGVADDLHLLSITCGGCAATWAGHDRAHCARCHTTYDSITLYDSHRAGRRCIRPQVLGLASTKNGIWTAAASTTRSRRTGCSGRR
jgi:hypothetical protein